MRATNCSIAGCDRPFHAKGFCRAHYNRSWRYGHPLAEVPLIRPSVPKPPQGGYVTVLAHGHPLADSRGRVLLHRKNLFDLVGPDPQPCHFCGIELPWRKGRKVKGQPGIEVDHVDSDRTNNDPLNLILVCPSHNTSLGMKGDHTALVLETIGA